MTKIEGSGPLVRGIDPRIRIRIHIKMSWMRNTALRGTGKSNKMAEEVGEGLGKWGDREGGGGGRGRVAGFVFGVEKCLRNKNFEGLGAGALIATLWW
jgi:hypothetical protein